MPTKYILKRKKTNFYIKILFTTKYSNIISLDVLFWQPLSSKQEEARLKLCLSCYPMTLNK